MLSLCWGQNRRLDIKPSSNNRGSGQLRQCAPLRTYWLRYIPWNVPTSAGTWGTKPTLKNIHREHLKKISGGFFPIRSKPVESDMSPENPYISHSTVVLLSPAWTFPLRRVNGNKGPAGCASGGPSPSPHFKLEFLLRKTAGKYRSSFPPLFMLP